MAIKVTLIDAFDSFIHIVDDYFQRLGCETEVIRADAPELGQFDPEERQLLVLGPGPGAPADGPYPTLLADNVGRVPIFGICLGHQAIVEHWGGAVHRGRPLHGYTSLIDHDQHGVFATVPSPLTVTRYHSLVAGSALPRQLSITARSRDDRYVMGVRHQTLPVESVQFHPESVLTQSGMTLIENVVRWATECIAARPVAQNPHRNSGVDPRLITKGTTPCQL